MRDRATTVAMHLLRRVLDGGDRGRRMSGGGHATARLFLAVDPPEQVCLELAGWARLVAARTPSPLRVLPAEALHITLCFLGSRPVDEIDALAAVPCASATEVGELSVGAPPVAAPAAPRNLTVEIHDRRAGSRPCSWSSWRSSRGRWRGSPGGGASGPT